MTPWTAAYQAPPSMGFSRQEYWSGVPLPSPICNLSSYYFIWIVNIQEISGFLKIFENLMFEVYKIMLEGGNCSPNKSRKMNEFWSNNFIGLQIREDREHKRFYVSSFYVVVAS